MNRETKIGMLTGLGVIVLIGMLLSRYFEHEGPRAADMHALGEPYRQAVQQPVGMAYTDGRGGAVVGGGSAALPMVSSGGGNELAVAYGRDAGPVLGAPVAPEMVGRLPDGRSAGGTQGPELVDVRGMSAGGPVVYTADPTKAAGGVKAAAATLPAGEMYTIAKGDTLMGIAKHFYHAAGKAEVARIVAANPGMLQDDKTMLVVGKKLVVPTVAKPAAPTPEVAKAPVADPLGRAGVSGRGMTVVRLPGVGDRSVAVGDGKAGVDVATPKPEEVKKLAPTYTVQAGDTLDKIARKALGAATMENVKKIAKLNRMDVDDVLQVGRVLKVPVKDVRVEAKG